MTECPAVRPSYPLSEVKAGVSCDPPSRCDRHDRYQFPLSRIEGCFRDSEKGFGFRSFDILKIATFNINGIRATVLMKPYESCVLCPGPPSEKNGLA
jgi:hypothetical protein